MVVLSHAGALPANPHAQPAPMAGIEAQTLSGPALVKALRQGGPVILLRHAQAPGDIPPRDLANPVNNPPERQLEAVGRATATAKGETFRELGSPVGLRPHKSHVSSKRAVPEPRHAPPAQTASLAASGHGVHSGHEYAPRHPLAQRSNCLSPGPVRNRGRPWYAARMARNVDEPPRLIVEGEDVRLQVGGWFTLTLLALTPRRCCRPQPEFSRCGCGCTADPPLPWLPELAVPA